MADEKVIPDPGTAGTGTAGTTATAIKAGGKEYGSVDDLVKAYESANTELGKWTQQHGDLKKQYDEISGRSGKWEEWWKTVSPLWDEDVEKLLQTKLMRKQGGQPSQAQQAQVQAQAATQQTQQGQTQKGYFDGFEYLRPEEQLQRFRQAIEEPLAQGFNQRLDQLNQAWAQHLTGRENFYQQYLTNYLGLMRKAFDQKLADPTFNIDAVMEQAAKAMGGQMEPIELGQQLLKAANVQSQMDAVKKASYEQGRKDFEQEQANKKLETVPPMGKVPVYKVPGTGGAPRKGLASLREAAAEGMAKKFGPSVFFGEQ